MPYRGHVTRPANASGEEVAFGSGLLRTVGGALLVLAALPCLGLTSLHPHS